MPKRIVPLSEIQVRNAKPKEKEYKLMDGYGLFLLVTPANGKLWRFDYRLGDKRKTLAFGAYPSVSLADARKSREDARKLLVNGVDPGEVRKAQKAAKAEAATNTFEAMARAWHENSKSEWSVNHTERLLKRLELDVFPYIGNRPIAEIKTPEIVEVLKLNCRPNSRNGPPDKNRLL